ncbi:MAG: ThiF family adenylyltransferase [Candidatus Nealsonbacteria bacterium]|nr:ThiF family adenylyltransferase [Candidatus Nealsonbacteria bacterium]
MTQKPIIYYKKNAIPKGVEIIEAFNGCLEELFFIRNPRYKKQMPEAKKPLLEFIQKKNAIKSVWIYYPWINKAVHCPEKNIFFEIKTARNKNIITKEEQNNYRKFKLGIMGLSIGSNIVWPLIASGGSEFLRIADADTIEISNLNRMLAPLSALGENKAEFMAKKIYEMDPFIELDCWAEYVTEKNIEKFISGLDLLIDEIDNLYLKFLSRKIARKRGIPLIMVTNVGNNVILDVERFDLEKNRPILHGFFGNMKEEELKNPPFPKWVQLANKIVGMENLNARMKKTISDIGKKIAAVPQIAPTALIAGSAVVYLIRAIANRQKIASGRYFLNIDKAFKQQ